jgi:hypothetical protein
MDASKVRLGVATEPIEIVARALDLWIQNDREAARRSVGLE